MEYKCIQAYSDHGLFETQDKSVQKNVARLLNNHEDVKAYKLLAGIEYWLKYLYMYIDYW